MGCWAPGGEGKTRTECPLACLTGRLGLELQPNEVEWQGHQCWVRSNLWTYDPELGINSSGRWGLYMKQSNCGLRV